MQQKPLISIIIPVYNCEKYISAAIESVFNQTYETIEIIVIDDGSTDESANKIKQFPDVRYHYQSHSGASAALNFGVSLAKGDLFAFLDADDLWIKEKLALQMQLLCDQPDIDLLFGHVEQFYSPELFDQLKNKITIHQPIASGYHRGTLLVPRDIFYQVGLFDLTWKMGEFIDWYLRATELNLKVSILPTVLLKRRIHDCNMGVLQRHHQLDYVKIIKAHRDRQIG